MIRKAMVFAAAEVTSIDNFVNAEDMVLEQKFDGTRAVCVVTKDSIEFLQRNGTPLKHTAAMQHFDGIREGLVRLQEQILPGTNWEIVLDGEIMIDTGDYILFDLPYANLNALHVQASEPYRHRRAVLAAMYNAGHMFGKVRLGAMATTPEEKRDLYDRVMANNGEGVMAKNLNAPYDEGKRVKHSLKLKFYRTADVVVMSWHRGNDGKDKHGNPTGRETGNISFGVYDSEGMGVLTHLGNCSIIGKPEVWNGCVIEVKYLYRGAGGALVQPTMIQRREDRDPESCTYEQFEVYSKSVLD